MHGSLELILFHDMDELPSDQHNLTPRFSASAPRPYQDSGANLGMRVVEPKQGLFYLWAESLTFPARKNSARLQTDKSRYHWPESPQIERPEADHWRPDVD
jgi:hypothetical protein